jgi:hypothetical protein
VSITLDDSAYPFVVQAFPVGPKTEAALHDR